MRRWLRFYRDLGLQLLALYLLLIIPSLLTLVGFDRVVGQRIRRDVEANDLALARAIALETDLSINNALNTVKELATYPSVINADKQGMGNLFAVVLNTRPDVNLIYRLGANGIMLYHYPTGPGSTVGTDFSFRGYFQRALQTDLPLVSEGRISPTTNQAVATAVMPIRSPEGKFLGLVGTNIKLESLSDTLKAIAAEHGSNEDFQLLILDSSNQVIAYPNPNLLLKSANDILPALDVNQTGASGTSEVKTAPDGTERLYTDAVISDIHWSVVVSRPAASAFATQIFLQRITEIAAATFILIGLFFWWALAVRVINPIEKLAPISEAIGLNQIINNDERREMEQQSQRGDQIGHLIRSILQMENSIAARLKEQATLVETGTAVVSSLDLATVLNRILEQVERLMEVRMSAIIALDESQGEFRIRASRGLSKNFTDQLAVQPSEPGSVTMRALHAREPVQVSDTENDPSYVLQRPRARAEGYRAIMAVPFNTQHAPPTALLVFNPAPRKFTNNEIQLLFSFANQATMAIENAILYERSDMRLQEQTRRLESLLQSMHDGLILSDLRGTVIYANRRVMELADLSTEDLPNAQANKLLARILNKTVNKVGADNDLKNILKPANEHKTEISLNDSGRSIHLRFEAFDVTDRRGIPIGQGLILHDITADYELDRMKSSLVSTVSHELRTPLAAIKGYATTLLAEDVVWDSQSQREFLTIISNETDRLSRLVDNLLDLSRMETGSLQLSLEECNLEELIQNAAKSAALNDGNRFEIQMDAHLPPLLADVPRLETILRNLIENSVKYGGPTARIHLRIQHEHDAIVFRVSDNGPGIPLEESKRIFDRFYRVDNSLARVASGAGLGLAICQGLVQAHGGEIWVEAQEVGVCIAFSIPLKTKTTKHKQAVK